ncbi:MAG: AI-2E family transporter [Terriglobales bacterium]
MLVFDARTARVLATLLLCGLALIFVYLAWRTLITFLFAILFAYLLEPLVGELQTRFHLGRGRAVAAMYVVLAAALGAFLFFVGPHIVQQAGKLAQLAPAVSRRLASGQIVQQMGQQRGWSWDTQQRIQLFIAQHQAEIAAWEQSLLQEVANVASNLWWVALVPILAIFFLMSGGRFSGALLEQLARRRQRAFVGELLQDVHDVLANYIRAQILLTALALGVYLLGFELLRVPYAIALGVVAGLLEFIPMIGPLLGAAMVLGTAFFSDYRWLLPLVLFLGAWRLLQDYYNSPRIMGGQLQLPSLAVLFGVLAGAEIGGVIGVYLSVPIMATLRVVWLRWRSFQDSQLVLAPPGGPSPESPPQAG